MLHTLHSLSSLQNNSEVDLDSHYYTIFDSRKFESSMNIDNTFASIKENFCKEWDLHIRSFIDALIKGDACYSVNPNKPIVLIPEEAIYLNLQGLDSFNISYFYASTKGFRLIGIDSDKESDKNNSLSIFSSPVYDPLHKDFYSTISIIFYRNLLKDCKNNPEVLNKILLRIANIVAITYIDEQLSAKHNVPLNRVLASNTIDANKDAIILPESFNISDTRFLYGYFECLFGILNTVLNTDFIKEFEDYSKVVSLPDIFTFDMTEEEAESAPKWLEVLSEEEAALYSLSFKHKIYKRIWDYSKRNYPISDKDYISICSDILRNLEVNLDDSCYVSNTMDDDQYYNCEEEEETPRPKDEKSPSVEDLLYDRNPYSVLGGDTEC